MKRRKVSYLIGFSVDFEGLHLYHRAAMSTGLPRYIQVLRGQGGERSYSGRIALDEMPRVKACVFAEQSSSIEVDFELNRTRRVIEAEPSIRVTLQLQCQRCMDSMQWQAELTNKIRLVMDEEAVAEDEQQDTFLMQEDGLLDVYALVEDEIILALPIAPLHQADSACGEQSFNKPVVDEEKPNPFAVLAALKPKH